MVRLALVLALLAVNQSPLPPSMSLPPSITLAPALAALYSELTFMTVPNSLATFLPVEIVPLTFSFAVGDLYQQQYFVNNQ